MVRDVIVKHSIVISRKKKSDIMEFTLTSISEHIPISNLTQIHM